jgi:hypothetical protein
VSDHSLTVVIQASWRGVADDGAWYWTLRHGRHQVAGSFPGPKLMRDGSVNVNVFHKAEKALVAKLGEPGKLVLSHHKVVIDVVRSYEFHGTRP